MNKILRLLLVGSLILAFPATVLAAQADTAETQEEGMLKPPGSQSSAASADSDSDSTDESSDDASVFSSGVDWSAANTASSPASKDTTFTVCIDPGHQGNWVDMSAQEPMAPGSSRPRIKQPPVPQETFPKFPSMKSIFRFHRYSKKN